jgi:exodeoxyribonuclease VIII
MLWQCNESDYHAERERFSHSRLNLFRDGGAAALADAVFYGIGREPTRAMAMGSALHCLVLETERFRDAYGLDRSKDFDRRTKAGKEGYAAWCDAAKDGSRTWLDRDEMALIHEQAEAIGRHKKAAKALVELPGLNEQAVRWDDPETGLPMKARLDRVLVDAGLVVDLKTTADVSPKEWERSSWEYRYHAQAALYLDAASLTWGKDFGFLFVCVSSGNPVQVAVRVPDEDLLEEGRRQNREAIRRIAEIRESGDWWSVETYSAPTWARK